MSPPVSTSAASTEEPAPEQGFWIPEQSLTSLFLRFLRFGCLAWGGPVAQIAMIQRELVEEERWISPERFRRALAVYQVLPGPEAHELCVYFGMLARGRIGAVLAGLGFMLPGFVLMMGLAALYANGALESAGLRPALWGMQAAVVAVIVRALHRIGHHTLRDRWLLGIAAMACCATLLGVHFAVVLAFGGLLVVLLRRGHRLRAVLAAGLFVGWTIAQWYSEAVTPDGAVAAPLAATAPSTMELFTSGLRSGLLTFGGAYTVIPFLQHDAVVVGGWMTDAQFLEGVALSGILPAPLIIFATHVGYVAGGWLGALAMTAGIFLPAFCFTLLGHGFFERVTGKASVHAFLDGVTAAVVGIMGASTLALLRAGVAEVGSACIALATLAALFLWSNRAVVPLVMLAGGALGVALFRG